MKILELHKNITDTLFDIEWRRLILDEAHQIKNPKSQQSVACCEIHAKSKWAMTGIKNVLIYFKDV